MAPHPRTYMPLPAHDLHILVALLDTPRHGYAIIQEVGKRTAGETRLGTSTVYAALKRMLAAGLIEETPRPRDVSSDDERRRYYRATSRGHDLVRAAARDVQRLHSMLRGAHLLDRPVPATGKSRT